MSTGGAPILVPPLSPTGGAPVTGNPGGITHDPARQTHLPPAASGTIELHPSWGTPVIVLVDGTPDRGGGVGGWEASERMLQPAGRWWKQQPGETLSIPAMLDAYEHAHGNTIELRLRRLYLMGRAYGKHDTPPTIRLRGDVRPEDRKRKWVMQDIALGGQDWRGRGVLERQRLSISLEAFYELPAVEGVTIKRTRGKGADQPRTRHYRVRKGDTLRSIAVRELGSSDQYQNIQAWNPKLKNADPDQPLQPGLMVTLH